MPCIVTMDFVVDCEYILKISRESSVFELRELMRFDSHESGL